MRIEMVLIPPGIKMASPAQAGAAHLYGGILNEIKTRIATLNSVFGGQFNFVPGVIAREFCFLQLRILCELIALGCLVAHGDIKGAESGKLKKSYEPDKIIRQLERLHPNFYPHPVTITVTPDPPPGNVHLERLETVFLTKRELLKLYGLCGNYLHRGPLKKFIESLPEMAGTTIRLDPALEWTNKIILLLKQHHIAALDNKIHFICTLEDAATRQSSIAIAGSPVDG